MRIKKLKNRVNPKLKNKKFKYEIETAEEDIRLPCLAMFCGARGTGKSYNSIALAKHFEDQKYITRTFLISPTLQSNLMFKNLKTLDDLDCCESTENFELALNQILERVHEDWEEYETEEMYTTIYKKARKGKELTAKEEKVLEENDMREPEVLKKPAHLLIIDDMQGTELYKNGNKNDLLKSIGIRHRHIPLSIFFLLQSWHAMPRALRLNATHFAVFKTGDKKQIYQIWEHFGTLVPFQEFMEMYKAATADPHGFLFIDTVPKKEMYRFRKGYNEIFEK